MEGRAQYSSRGWLVIIVFLWNMSSISCFSGNLYQLTPTSFEFRTDGDMVIISWKPLSIFSITVENNSDCTYSISVKDSRTISIETVYTRDIVYKQLRLTVQNPLAIKSPTGESLSQTVFTSWITYYVRETGFENSLSSYIAYIAWTVLGVYVFMSFIFFIYRVDTVLIWIALEFFQLIGLINLLDVTKPLYFSHFISEINKTNFYFLPNLFESLMRLISTSAWNNLATSASSYSLDYQNYYLPISTTSFICTTGNALILITLFSLIVLLVIVFKGIQIKCIFNSRALYRLIDILLIHFVFSAFLQIRNNFPQDTKSIANIVDTCLAIIVVLLYAFFTIIMPYRSVNSIEIIMLERESISEAKHFIARLRVEYFFSRNYFIVRTFLKYFLSLGIALQDVHMYLPGIIILVILTYFLTILFLSIRYPPYDQILLNGFLIIQQLTIAILALFLLILWTFQESYLSLSYKSSLQLDSAYIAINKYTSWFYIFLIAILTLIAVPFLLNYLSSTKQTKFLFNSQIFTIKSEEVESKVKPEIEMANQTETLNDSFGTPRKIDLLKPLNDASAHSQILSVKSNLDQSLFIESSNDNPQPNNTAIHPFYTMPHNQNNQ